MSLSQILNIAIVICGVYAGLSCLSSWVNERIAAFLALRGWNLFRGIANLLGTDELASKVFNHPLIAANSPKPNQLLSTDETRGVAKFFDVAKSRPPSYLDARNFSSALWQLLPTIADPPTPAPTATTDPSGAATTAAAQAAVAAPLNAVANLEAVVGRLGPQHAKLKQQLLAILAQANGEYTKLLAATDAWFNAEMDRVSGWYARQTQWIIIVIAFFIVTFSGVDTLEMVRTLSVAKPAELTAISDRVVKQACQTLAATSPCPSPAPNLTPPSSAPSTSENKAPVSLTNGPTKGDAFDVTQFAHVHISFDNWGWMSKTSAGLQYYRWEGMLLTWVALALGGPFWFNLLCSFTNIRSAGAKPSDSSQSQAKT
ncbi:MAG TPA: hypothetical protein VHT92_08155 [Candidatus Cybelea sp.]|jgi:hypothetical protein|nr:hypothetical protein [Candidatus Cybelea sp.]